jgi:2-(1,2-epoxy-1,2-dihydrophenyl)acetyl-CoA isomerase
MKENFRDAEAVDFGAYMDAETVRHLQCTTTADHREGVTAFAEKRTPAFGGR